ncbi:transporter [Mycetocola spongiae]|uniref:transporter n=1 Tax=Mycetocola spongiae TaxID=2859226 RepID=UPI001CF1195D|nr:transporter [Mycetocola spongiae]UCR90113.1 transporter [Mycetocola spongiae]
MAQPLLGLAEAPVAAGVRTSPAGMVRVLVRLRFRVMINTLMRHKWQLVGAIIGALYGLGLLTGAVIGLFALSLADYELARTALIIAGSVLILGWIIGPIVSSGMDRTLDPARLMTFPMRPETLMTGIAAASLLGIPGIITFLLSLTTAGTWLHYPVAAIAAVLLAPVAAMTCVLACQLATTALSRLAANRRFREIIAGVLIVLLVLLGPILSGVTSGFMSLAEALPGLANVLSWTPLGAVWAVPAEIAGGHWGPAGLKLLIALATLALLFLAWRPLFLTNIGSSNEGSRTTVRSGTGWFRHFPATPRGAIAARALTYWLRDPRYLQSLIVVLVFPVMFAFLAHTTELPILLPGSTVILAMLLALSTFTDVSYDGTAFSTHVMRGVRGIDDRLGRIWANALVTVGPVLVIAVVTTAIVGRWDQLPTLLGLCAAVTLGGFGVSSVCSAIFVMPVPQSGENPFASKPGAGMLSMVGMLGSYGALLVISLPAIACAIIAGITVQPLWAWLTLLVGVLGGALFFWIGVRWGARIFDRRAPDLLAKVMVQGS